MFLCEVIIIIEVKFYLKKWIASLFLPKCNKSLEKLVSKIVNRKRKEDPAHAVNGA